MSIILDNFNINNVYFNNPKNNGRYNSSFYRINYGNDLMTLKSICIQNSNDIFQIEQCILNKYIEYQTYNKPTPSYSLEPKLCFQNIQDCSDMVIKISGVWENNEGTCGLTFKTS